MNISYTRLGILLLRIEGVLMILQAIPNLIMSIPAIFRTAEFAGFGAPNYAISLLLQPVIGVLLLVFSNLIARKVVGFLDEK